VNGKHMSNAHNKNDYVCMNARHAQKIVFSCACKQNISPKLHFLVYVRPINRSEAFSRIDLKLNFREVEQ
jgi:hypothetical protein